MIHRVLIAAAIFLSIFASPARAQFADQATFAGTGGEIGGNPNQQSITVPNASQASDLVGVLIKYIPGFTNTAGGNLTVNNSFTITLNKPTASGLASLTGGELQAGQPVIVMLTSVSGVFVVLSVTSTTVTAANLANSALSFGMPVNLQLNATVNSNQLTIAVKGNNAADPSATNPVLIPFRNGTIASGNPLFLSLQAAQSFTIGSGNTMGCVSAQMCRLWVIEFWNGTTPALCAFNALSGTNIAPINEGVLQTSASGTTGGSSAQTYYCSVTALTNYVIRILGYIEIQETTAGTWATGPTYVTLFGPGIKKPGDVVQIVPGTTSSQTACSGANTQTSLQAPITPTTAANVIEVDADWTGNTGTTSSVSQFFRLSRGTGPTYFGSEEQLKFTISGGTLNLSAGGHLSGIDVPNTTSSTTYSVYCVNGGGANFNGDTQPLYMKVKEIMSALEPANDNALVLRKAA